MEIHPSHFRPKPPKKKKPVKPSYSSSSDGITTPPFTPPSPPPALTKPPPKPPPKPQAPSQQAPGQTPQKPLFRLIPPGKNHYATLNIPITSTPSEIQQAYCKALAAIPNNEDNFDSESLHLQNVLDEAMHILTHPYKKTIFDRAYLDELLDYHDLTEQGGEVGGSKPGASKGANESRAQTPEAVKLKQWTASLMNGLKGEGEGEEVFGRVPWAMVEERKWHFKLESDFGGTVEDCMLWAPNLFAGGVSGFEGWTG